MASFDKDFVYSSPLSDDDKAELSRGIVSTLTEITGTEPDELMAEFVMVMLENGKSMGGVVEALAELTGEDDATLLVADLHQRLVALGTDCGHLSTHPHLKPSGDALDGCCGWACVIQHLICVI